MKFLQAFTALCTLVAPVASMVNTAKDQHHINREFIGNSLWVFGSEGVTIFNPDGSANLKSIDKNDICHMVPGYHGNDMRLSCSFYDVVSDGKRFVWAAVSRGIAKIDILDIDTGDIVGAFETCMNPRKLEYHPLREEIWVRCSEVESNATSPSYLDVFSTSSPSVAIETDMLLKEDSTLSSRGFSVIDNTLGDVGYVTDRDQPYLFKIDLSDKSIIDKFELPLAYGAYEVAYSPMNRHVFVRGTVCCTCGFEGADVLACSRYGSDSVNVTTGNWAGSININGMCNRCDGLVGVDTLGVYEFDTTTDTFVGNHIMKEGFGGDPFPSPDGKYIVLIGRNGGTSVRILKAGATNEKSTVFADLELGFNSTTYEDDQIFTDFAFVEQDGKSLFVIVAGTENRAAIVDLDNINNPVFVQLAIGENTARRRRRQVEWAVGTPYVWVDGTGESEIYVIDAMKGVLVNTIEGLYTSKLLSVQNYAKMNEARMQQELIDEAIAASAALQESMKAEATGNSATTESSGKLNVEAAAAESASQNNYTDDNDIDAVGIIGLILGCCALIVGTMNVFVMSSMKSQITSTSVDLVSLGSKDVS